MRQIRENAFNAKKKGEVKRGGKKKGRKEKKRKKWVENKGGKKKILFHFFYRSAELVGQTDTHFSLLVSTFLRKIPEIVMETL